MTKTKTFLTVLLVILNSSGVFACTNFLVTKGASTDSSTMITYSADSYELFGALYHYPAADYPKGTLLSVYEWDTGNYSGEIEQVAHTYSVIGNMNEYQVAIGETTFGGREELVDTTGIMDYGSLIYITLQRAKSAREAIKVMTDLVQKYGYCSSGESFSIADPNEVWIMELIGKGVGNKGAVWVAQRIPDGYVSAHANQARITTFPLEKKKNSKSISSKNMKKLFNPEVEVIYSYDVIDFARKQNYFSGKDEEFSFSDTYNPLDFGGLRFCEARVWSFFRIINTSTERFLSYINGETKERMPLWVKPNTKISAQDMKNFMRNHYEGTPLDMTQGMGAGAYNSPFRPSPLVYKVDNVEYFHERPVATQQTGFTFVAQMRNWLPDPVGGILWFGVDDATTNLYVPMYCGITTVPHSFSIDNGSLLEFSWTSAFWVNNWVGNMVYNRYSHMMPDVKKEQEKWETFFNSAVQKADQFALTNDTVKMREFLTDFSHAQAETALKAWTKLGQFLMVKYLDGVTKAEKDGQFEQNEKRMPNNLKRPGYPEDFNKKTFVTPDPERFRMRSDEEMQQRK
ncbi:MAG TPA: C69 family dipeptidase [Salinivirgaceae bacterium]|nr:C69 family dipeptidase [Salinivirgaceae bacterium]HRS67615.1 C69 family dipeptidase [Paludibacteraceae bacterium]